MTEFVTGTGPRIARAVALGALSWAAAASADEIHVPADYPTIQAAIDAALDGDEIVVAPGSYAENLIVPARALALRSSGGAAVTTLDGGALGAVIRSDAGPGLWVLEGFTITGGSGDGAGLYADGLNLEVRDCVFVDNDGRQGGGALARGGAQLDFLGCLFQGNTALGGGGVRALDTSGLTLAQCDFIENTANNRGGAIGVNDGELVVVDCAFIGNTADFGGGVHASGPATIDGATFNGNTNTSSCSTEPGAGAAYLGGRPAQVRDSVFEANTSFDCPGAIGGGADVIERCVFRSNGTSLAGVIETGGEVLDCVFEDSFGSAVKVFAQASARIAGGRFRSGVGNTEDSVVTTGSQATLLIEDSTFSDNDNWSVGVVLAVESGAHVSLSRCGFHRNRSTVDPLNTSFGAVYVAESGRLDAVDCVFTHNEGGAGAAIHQRGSTRLVRCAFVENVARATGGQNGFGGAIRNQDGDLTVLQSFFLGNGAERGGGIFTSSPADLLVANCVFSANRVELRGGAAGYGADAAGTLVNSVFHANNSRTGGNTLNLFAGAAAELRNCIVTGPAGAHFVGMANPIVTYSLVQGGFPGEGNVDGGPGFQTAAGQWTAAGVYDPNSGLTTLADASASWTPGALAGDTLRPFSNSPFVRTLVVDNTATTATVWGEFLAPAGGGYVFESLRPAPDSPCIDAGRYQDVPLDALDLDGDGDTSERLPLDLAGAGRFIQQGQPTCFDLDGDGVVSLTDLAIVLASFGVVSGADPSQGDTDADGDVDLVDLARIITDLACYAAVDMGAYELPSQG